MQQFAVQLLLIGLVAHGEIHPGLLIHNAFAVGEGLEPGPAVVGPHAALPHAAESHGAGGQVDDHVVDASAAELQAAHGLPDAGAVLGEQVQGQRLGPVRQALVDLLEAVIGEDGQNGAENLLLHHRIALRRAVQNDGGDLQGFRRGLPAENRLVPVDQAQQAVKVPLVDDPAVVRVLQRVLAVLPPDLPAQQLHQPAPHAAVAEDVVRGHAGLAAVEVLAEHNPPGRQGEFGGLVHNAGALAPQLQHRRGQVLRRPAQHLAAHGLAAGKKDEVELLLQQRGVLPPAAGDGGHVLRREALADQICQQGADGGGVGAGLHHGGVPGGDGVGQGVQGQQHRVIPGAHNQRAAVGGALPEAAGGKLGQGRGDGVRPRQPAHVPEHPADLPPHKAGFAHEALIAALAKVGRQGGPDLRLAAVDRVQQPLEHLPAEGHRQRSPGAEKLPLALDNVVDVHRSAPCLLRNDVIKIPPAPPRRREPPQQEQQGHGQPEGQLIGPAPAFHTGVHCLGSPSRLMSRRCAAMDSSAL